MKKSLIALAITALLSSANISAATNAPALPSQDIPLPAKTTTVKQISYKGDKIIWELFDGDKYEVKDDHLWFGTKVSVSSSDDPEWPFKISNLDNPNEPPVLAKRIS